MPLIVVIVAFVALLPIFIPDGSRIDVVVRTFIAFAIFNSAYMAEVFRGGLQSIPKGQYEAARSIGLGYWKTMGYIVLPQAIRNSVPALVNTCISIFKETTLLLLVGFSDLLGIIQLSLEDPKWLGPPNIFASAYLSAALIYFIFCYGNVALFGASGESVQCRCPIKPVPRPNRSSGSSASTSGSVSSTFFATSISMSPGARRS